MQLTIPKPQLRAKLAANTINEEDRTVDVVFYSGATVPMFSWERGAYNLSFEMKKSSIRLETLKGGAAPVLDAHNSYGNDAVLGVVESASLSDSQGVATIRFAKGDPRADAIWNKISQRVLKNVSMGAIIHRMKEVTPSEEDKKNTFLAVDWEPYEISVVPIGADKGAKIQMSEQQDTVVVEIEEKGVTLMEKGTQAGAILDDATRPVVVDIDKARTDAATQAMLAERNRVVDIRARAKPFVAQLGEAFVDQLISTGASADEAGRAMLAQLATVQEQSPQTRTATVLRDEVQTRRELAESVILNKVIPDQYKVDPQNQFRGMRVSRMAEEILQVSGTNTRGMTVNEIANLSMQNTADFPFILENSARKMLLASYGAATPTYRIWAKPSTTPDFKTMSRARLSETPSFLTVAEGAQITIGTMSESREQYALVTRGRGVSFTRQMLINDDMGAFNDLIGAFGLQAARDENKTVYAVLTANANMSDGVALFHATHANLGSGVIANAGLDSMFTSFAIQKGLDGATILNLMPKFLIVPAAKAATAANSQITTGPSLAAASQNWFAGRLTVVPDGELDASSAVIWYGAADPTVAPGVEYCHLEGASGPQIVRKENESGILGIQLYAFNDFAAKAVDFRSLYKSTGA
jgi:hypothetical protein